MNDQNLTIFQILNQNKSICLFCLNIEVKNVVVSPRYLILRNSDSVSFIFRIKSLHADSLLPTFYLFIWIFLCSSVFYYLNFCYNEVYVFKLLFNFFHLYICYLSIVKPFKLYSKVYNSVADFKDKKWSTSHTEQSSKHIHLDRSLLPTHSVHLVIRKNHHQIFSI